MRVKLLNFLSHFASKKFCCGQKKYKTPRFWNFSSVVSFAMKLTALVLVALSVVCAFGTPVEEIAPSFDAWRDIHFMLQTRAQRTPTRLLYRDLNSTRVSTYNPNNPTRIL